MTTAALAARNRYLVTPSGGLVGSRIEPALVLAPLVGGPLVGAFAIAIGSVLDLPIVAALGALVGFALFVGSVVAAWVFLLAGSRDVAKSAQMWLAGDTASPVPLCHKALRRVFRADVRMRAFYTLALCAEANADFAEADDLFRRAFDAIPAMAIQKWKRRGQCMMLAHRAIALVSMGRLPEADRVVRDASALFPPLPGGGIIEALGDDAALGVVGISAALRDLEPGREPRALLTLASAVVLAARGMGREALELVDRERHSLTVALLPREQALLAAIETRGRALLAGGPMRSPGLAFSPADTRSAAWAERVLPLPA